MLLVFFYYSACINNKCKFPGVTGIFLFDNNAPSHRSIHQMVWILRTWMSILEENKQSRGTQFGMGKHKKMVLPDGTAKGMKLVLQERGVKVKGLNAEKMREKMK